MSNGQVKYAEDNYRCHKPKQPVQLRSPHSCRSRTDDPDEEKDGHQSSLGVKIEDRVMRLLRHDQGCSTSAPVGGPVDMRPRAKTERSGVEAFFEGAIPQMQALLRRAFGCRATLTACQSLCEVVQIVHIRQTERDQCQAEWNRQGQQEHGSFASDPRDTTAG